MPGWARLGAPWAWPGSVSRRMASTTIAVKAVHRITVVTSCRYLVLDRLKKVKGPRARRKATT